MIKRLKDWWLRWQLRRDVRWTERYIPTALERVEPRSATREDLRAAIRQIRGDTSPVIDTHDGFDGMTVNEKAVWMVAYQDWVAGRGPTDEELVSMSTEDFQRYVQAKRDASFLPVQYVDHTPAYEQGLTPQQWLEQNPNQGLVMLAGVNLRRVGEAYQRMEAGLELTPYDKELIALRPGLDLAAINRQLRAIGKPQIRSFSPDQKEIL